MTQIDSDKLVQVGEVTLSQPRGRGRTISIPWYRLVEMGMTEGDRLAVMVHPEHRDMLILKAVSE